MSGASHGVAVPRLGSGHQGVADLVLRGGAIYVGPDGRGKPTFAEALAVRDGRVAVVGEDRTVEGAVGPGTAVLDLDGRTVVPGLIDGHAHFVRGGLTWLHELDWYETPTLEEGLALLDREAQRLGKGAWLRVVGGWHPGQFEEGRGPTREELTRRFPDNPVYVQLLYEEAVLNDAGLEAAGITAQAPDPPLGTFERDTSGEPTGTVRGVGAFMHCMEQGGPPSFDDQVRGTGELMRLLHGWGLTGGIDAGGLGMPAENYQPLVELWRRGEATLRSRLYVGSARRGEEEADISGWVRHVRPGFGDDWLRHIGVGEITAFGCHDLEGLTPFEISAEAKETFRRIATDCARYRYPLHMHAILDDTVSAVLDVWEDVAREHPIRDLRWSLAHADPISPGNLDRVRALGCGIGVQNRLVYRATDSARAWGEDTVRQAPPLRSIVERGIPLGAGTDSTRVASPNPWVALWWLVTGGTFDDGPARDAAQCLTRAEALEAYTTGSAWFSFEEGQRGRLAPGMLADFAVLTDDYFSVDDRAIRELAADLTVVDGRVVHADGPFAGLERQSTLP